MRLEAKRTLEAVVVHLEPGEASALREILERVLSEMSIKDPCADVATQFIRQIKDVMYEIHR